MQKALLEAAKEKLAPISRQAAAEGIVLLENNQALPFTKGTEIALFGRCQINTYRSGTGSGGAVNVPYAINIAEGLRQNSNVRLNESLAAVYAQWVQDHPFDDGGGGWAAEPWFQQEMPLDDTLVKQAAQQSDCAVVVIGRTAGEDQDNADKPGSYRLTESEHAMLVTVTQHFDTVIIVLNVTNIIDMSWLNTLAGKQSIKAVLYNWAAGMEGGHALADILTGEVSPSGRLTDTIAHQLSDYPSSANFGNLDKNYYAEDIYVGYKYFETFKPEAVQYPFGAGLSYTQFSQKLISFATVETNGIEELHFHIEVVNKGDTHSGKEVIQLYVEAPQGNLGKPARALVGFSKTKELRPGESELVRIVIPVSQLASYDDSGASGAKSCYVLEAGEYRFYSGDNVRQAHLLDARFEVTELRIVEKLTEALAPISSFDRMKPAAKAESGHYRVGYEAAPMRTISLKERIEQNLPQTLTITGDKGIKLIDVKQGHASMEAFIAQLSSQQLATIVRGEGMCSPKVTPGTAAAFGGVSDTLFDFGIPVAAAADGPSGIRMDSGHKATQLPIGTLLGCTWNSELNEYLFNLLGQELLAYQIDTLLGPGINIHRHPLNGRNFEYFSEDSLLTGVMAAAQVKGLKEAGVTGTIKHFAANDQETARMNVDSIMSERALREIHIKAFEMAVKEGGATTIMTSYNPINGHWGASNYDLNTTILRNEWGFDGIVMSDWWAKMNSPIDAGKEDKSFTSYMVRAQNDLYMVVGNEGAETNPMKDNTLQALEDSTLTLGELQRCAMNICRFVMNAPVMDRPLKPFEPIKAFKAIETITERESICINDSISLECDTNVEKWLNVKQSGTYQVSATMSYDRNSLAQSSCSLSINDDFSMSLSINGTDGDVIAVDGLQIRLTSGYYKLAVDFVKPGLVIHQLNLSKVD
ncbi:glycoside hydrolase family 3 protein [Vibrio mediterranei]|uniref:glycoside hydrolase family 3 protein n=1 Tax=Vibrio mediterranei TaxID=689 RepID=UPI00406980A1